MQPDICIKCNKNDDVGKLIKAIEKVKDNGNNQIFIERYESQDKVVNLSITITEDLSKKQDY